MNDVIKTLINHASHRHFVNDVKILENHLDMILSAVQQAPSWQNGQHYSVVVVDDQKTKQLFFQHSQRNPQIASCSVFLVFCLDFTMQFLASQRQNVSFEVVNNPETLMIATTDASLAMQNAIVAAESLGYGTVPIGGVRQMSQVVIDALNLPKYVVPFCGLCIGTVDYTQEVERVKPRFAKKVKCHRNVYQLGTLEDLEVYEQCLTYFAEKRETLPWGEKFANYYAKNPNPDTLDVLKQQGL